MGLLAKLKNNISDRLFVRSVNRYGSKMGRTLAPIYSKYHAKCRAIYTRDSVAPDLEAVHHFRDHGFATYWTDQNKVLADSMLAKIKVLESEGKPIWDDDLGYIGDFFNEFPEVEQLFRSSLNEFLEAAYGSYVKIFYGKLYKAVRNSPAPSGSQIWHSDGGPGTCTNVMFYLSEGTKENGAMEAVTWDVSRKLFSLEKAEMRLRIAKREKELGRSLDRNEIRETLSNWYGEEILTHYSDKHFQPIGQPGTVLAFSNNTIHRGGFPHEGHTRYVIVFHIYPSETSMPYDKYNEVGIPKIGAYPKNPAF